MSRHEVNPDAPILDRDDCAALLKVSLPTLDRLIKTRGLPSFDLVQGGRPSLRFSRALVLAWIVKESTDRPREWHRKKAASE